VDKTAQEIEAIRAKFAAIGETQVRINLDSHKYGEASGKRVLARIWLDEQAQIKKDSIKIPWHKTSWGIALITLFVGLTLAGLTHYLGWR
jgi:hypothetical protein